MSDNGQLKQCTIILTRNCNLRCDFCFAKKAGYSADNQINIFDLKKVVDFCCDAKIKYIFFTGGEPLTYPYLQDILSYIKTKQSAIVTAVASNGVLLSDFEICKNLIDNGLGYIDISMKGKNASYWKKITGYDGMEEQLQAIRNLSLLPIEFTCSMVITAMNVMTICDSVQKAIENGAKQFSFTFLIDNSDTEEKGLRYLEKNNPFELIESFIAMVDRLNNLTDDWWIEYSFPLCVYTDKQLEILEGRLASPCQIHMKNAITINPKLELLPCDMYIEDNIGHFGQDFSSYQEFLKFSEEKNYMSLLEELRKQPSEKCGDCHYLEKCYGGCPVLWKNYSFESLLNFKEKYYGKTSIHDSD